MHVRSDDPRYGPETIHQMLLERGVEHEMLEHPPTFRARDEAAATGVAPGEMTKTIVAVDGERVWLVLVPASREVDMQRLREHLGATRHLRLATEDEIAMLFEGFEVGATPPFGALLGVPEVVDRHVLDHERVVCSAGDHEHSVRLSTDALVAVGDGNVAEVCLHNEGGRRVRFSDTPLH